MKKMGIMGGTFNPIHMGHIAIAQAAYEQFALDKVLFVPSGNPPHKKGKMIASNEDRYKMVCLATMNYPFFKVSSIELERGGYSYTFETLEALKKQFEDTEFYFILGADSLFYFDKWKNPQDIVKNAVLLVANRDDSDDTILMKHILRIQAVYGGRFEIMDTPRIPISSTQIRKGTYLKELVPTDVIDYIETHHLYQEERFMEQKEPVLLYTDTDKIKKILHKLKKKLDSDRYVHTLSVAYTAAALAMSHGLDFNKAYIAGLLHDCAKCISDEKKITKCEKNGIEITEIERRCPYLLHSKLGAYLAEHKYGITDSEILNAVTFHTTGKPAMSKLELIIFIADYIEPGRNKAKHLKAIRRLAFKDLEECAYTILKDTVSYLSDRGDEDSIDQTTMESFLYYEKRMKKRKKGAKS